MLGKILTLFTLLFCIAIPAKADLKIIYSTPGFGAYYNGNKYFNNKHGYNYRNRHNYSRKQHIINPYLNRYSSSKYSGYKRYNSINKSRYGYYYPSKRYYSPYKKSYKRGYNHGYYDALKKYSRKSYSRH